MSGSKPGARLLQTPGLQRPQTVATTASLCLIWARPCRNPIEFSLTESSDDPSIILIVQRGGVGPREAVTDLRLNLRSCKAWAQTRLHSLQSPCKSTFDAQPHRTGPGERGVGEAAAASLCPGGSWEWILSQPVLSAIPRGPAPRLAVWALQGSFLLLPPLWGAPLYFKGLPLLSPGTPPQAQACPLGELLKTRSGKALQAISERSSS